MISVFDYKITVNENPYIEKSDNQNIHLFTQERVLIFEALNSQKIDYVVFDEVQELLSIVKKAHAERAVLLAKSISLYENKNVPMVFLMPLAIEETLIDNFDYFIGKDSSCKIDRKINKMPQSEKDELEERLKFSTYEDCEYVMEKLCEIYDWKNSKNIDEKYRMTSIKYMATVFYNNFFGVSIKNSINSMIALNKKSEDYVLAIMKTNTQDAKLYPKILKRSNYSSVRNFVRLYEDSDINLLIYSYIYETQNIIEFRVKKYLQDLYYRLLKSKNRQIKSIEDYLIYSVSNNDKKINLNKLGLIDSFAIDELTLRSELFDGDTPNIHRMKEYANSLSLDEPLRYAILDVIV